MSPLPSRSTRLKPPATLSPAARTIFVSIVTDEPASHFKISDLPLLTAYCEASALAARAAPCGSHVGRRRTECSALTA
jgi:hypothetical protein